MMRCNCLQKPKLSIYFHNHFSQGTGNVMEWMQHTADETSDGECLISFVGVDNGDVDDN